MEYSPFEPRNIAFLSYLLILYLSVVVILRPATQGVAPPHFKNTNKLSLIRSFRDICHKKQVNKLFTINLIYQTCDTFFDVSYSVAAFKYSQILVIFIDVSLPSTIENKQNWYNWNWQINLCCISRVKIEIKNIFHILIKQLISLKKYAV